MENINIYIEGTVIKRVKGLSRIIEGITVTYARKRRCQKIVVKISAGNKDASSKLEIICPDGHKGEVLKEINMTIFAMVMIIPTEKYDMHYKI